jgi:hypothetical protein
MSLPNWVTASAEAVEHWVAAVGAAAAALLGWSNRNKIQEVHLTMNSRLDQLLKTTEEHAHDQGRQEGIEAEQQRMRPADPQEPPK